MAHDTAELFRQYVMPELGCTDEQAAVLKVIDGLDAESYGAMLARVERELGRALPLNYAFDVRRLQAMVRDDRGMSHTAFLRRCS